MSERMTDQRYEQLSDITENNFSGVRKYALIYMTRELMQALEAEREAFESSQRIDQILHNQIEELDAQSEAVKAKIQDCRDAWAPDQPPSDLSQFLIDLESVLE